MNNVKDKGTKIVNMEQSFELQSMEKKHRYNTMQHKTIKI